MSHKPVTSPLREAGKMLLASWRATAEKLSDDAKAELWKTSWASSLNTFEDVIAGYQDSHSIVGEHRALVDRLRETADALEEAIDTETTEEDSPLKGFVPNPAGMSKGGSR